MNFLGLFDGVFGHHVERQLMPHLRRRCNAVNEARSWFVSPFFQARRLRVYKERN